MNPGACFLMLAGFSTTTPIFYHRRYLMRFVSPGWQQRRYLLSLALMCSLLGCSKDPEPAEDMGQAMEDMAESKDQNNPADMPADMASPPEDMGQDQGQPPEDMTEEVDLFVEPNLDDLTEEQRAIARVPRTEAWALAGLKEPVHVVFTEHGRPHVYATNREDLGYVLGFIVARDRYFVMDLQRRLAQGTISSLLGDAALPNDVEARMIGMDHVTQRVLDNLSPETEVYLDAYVRGINEYIERVKSKELPGPSELETFKLVLGLRNVADAMEPFTRRDIAAMVAVIMYETNFSSGDIGRTSSLLRLDSLYNDGDFELELRRAGAREDVWKGGIAPLFDVASAPGFGSGANALKGNLSNPELPVGSLAKLPAGMLDRARQRHERLEERFGRSEVDNFGSNTWAVQGTKTMDGVGLVAGDGHLPLSVPALMYQIGMDTTTFGEEELRQAGLLITSLPVLAVGTNGKVAWSQVNPFADITDWYREELTLDAEGKPASTTFEGQTQPLTQVDESYDIAEVRALDSEERTEVWPRWVTFDGRWLFEIEGRELASPDEAQAGEYVVNLAGRYVVPGDTDNDGVVTAISFDYTAFDATRYVDILDSFTFTNDVYEYQEATKGLIGNMLYSAVTDDQGNILFTSYQAVPCRNYLPRDAQNEWMPGAHPQFLLDGKTYGGFTIPSSEDGKVDEQPGQDDPYRCVVPFDQTPQVVNPPQGFVLNGNNQPAPITNDGSLSDDPWYVGGPWRAVRGDSIQQGLIRATSDGAASVEDMAEIQADTRSRTGEMFAAHFVAAITKAQELAALSRVLDEDEQRLVDIYNTKSAQFDEVATRYQAWVDADFPTPSGVETFYASPSEQDREMSVSTMIFNAHLPRVMRGVFNDEDLVYANSGSVAQMRVLKRMLDGRQGNSTSLQSYNATTEESIFFDRLGTAPVERSEEVILTALGESLDFLAGAPTGPAEGGFGTDDMSAWIWGLRHQVRFESLLADFLEGTDFGDLLDAFSITTDTLPLAENLSQDDPRAALKWFPRPGDNFAVDAANPGFSGERFTHGSGPVMRMVIALKDGEVFGQNIIPGGQSGLNNSPYFADQAALWLANDTVPFRYYPAQVAEGAIGRAFFVPLPPESE